MAWHLRSVSRHGLSTLAAGLLLGAGGAHAAYVGSLFATDLNNPRGLAFGPDGELYVAEAGVAAGSGPTTEVRGNAYTLTQTGSLTRVLGGVPMRVLQGLPSLYFGTEVIGPQGVAFGADGTRYLTVGAGIDPAVRGSDLQPGGGALGQLWRNDTQWVDVAAYERLVNPAGGPFDSNPWRGVPVTGGVLVTDAGANALLMVAEDGTISTVTTFDQIVMTNPFPPGGAVLADAVPTGLAIGADGSIYVGMLTGFPFEPGTSDVYRIAPDGSVSIYASGFTNVTDLAFGLDGSLYVLEFDANGMLQPGDAGALIRVGADGSQTTLYSEGLVAPTGLAIGADGAFYVSTVGPDGRGMVLRIAEVPEPATAALLGAALAGCWALRGRRRAGRDTERGRDRG